MLPKIKAGALRWRYGATAVAMLAPLAIQAAPASAGVMLARGSLPIQQFVNKAHAIVTENGRTVFALRFKIWQTAAPEVDAENHAVALADECDNCDAVGIAVQVVFASEQDLIAIRAHNTAEATDYKCDTSCSALAEAYQIVIANENSAPPSWQQIRGLSQAAAAFERLKHSGLDNAQVETQADAIISQLMTVLENPPGSWESPVTPASGLRGLEAPEQPGALTQTSRPVVDLYHDIQSVSPS